MTEQKKIPLPSSVERAISGFDLSKLGGIASPGNLPPDARQRVVMRELTIEPMPEPPAEAVPAETPEPRHAVPMRPEPLTAAPVAFPQVFHAVDRVHLRNQGMIVPEGSVTALLEELRIVKRQLLVQSADLRRGGMGAAAQRVLICSPLPGEGKTYTAVNLALAIAAEKESEVILVDADFAKPSVLSTLGLPGGPGLMDALADPAIDVADCVLGTDIPGLWVLPAGNATTADTEYLASSRTRSVLDRLTQGAPHRMVIFDSPPALAASPAAELAKYVGQALVIARADRTGQSALEDAISLLSACPNIQLLLNAVRFSPSGRRFGTYYGYKG
ncbi:capsular biosynthesis protein [Novosphingobium flavum]|uniref:Capsular biosynthesis protein n=1 Tax=Novosphingobium flavum TaxID=1778672 RepID=A0A7X1KMI7_9SPHN|nr:capsular biosynthesis protein [Novosphingobium flavum]MBC2666345.1 capsular biosynthesis protein [Novosphingobium flavum]